MSAQRKPCKRGGVHTGFMSNITESLSALIEIPGLLAVSIVDTTSGMILAQNDSGSEFEFASAGHAEVVRAESRAIQNLDERISDILVTLSKQYHIMRPLRKEKNLFIYCVLDEEVANLALARHRIREVESQLVI